MSKQSTKKKTRLVETIPQKRHRHAVLLCTQKQILYKRAYEQTLTLTLTLTKQA